MTYEIIGLHRYPNVACAAASIIEKIVRDQPEMTWNSTIREACCRVLGSIEELERVELVAYDVEQLIAIAVLVPDHDPHVGKCLTVQWRWIDPDHRGPLGAKLHRRIIQVARSLGYKVLAYTKTLGPGRYELTYMPLEKSRG